MTFTCLFILLMDILPSWWFCMKKLSSFFQWVSFVPLEKKSSVVINSFYLSTWRIETGRLQVQGYPGMWSETLSQENHELSYYKVQCLGFLSCAECCPPFPVSLLNVTAQRGLTAGKVTTLIVFLFHFYLRFFETYVFLASWFLL